MNNLINNTSYTISRLAKEKGFDLKTIMVYDVNPESINFQKTQSVWLDGTYPSDQWKDGYLHNPHFIPSPTYTQLQKWLREVHDIEVWASPFTQQNDFPSGEYCDLDGTYSFYVFKDSKWSADVVDFETYEIAMDMGLIHALTIIK